MQTRVCLHRCCNFLKNTNRKDVIARRIRLAFLNSQLALECLPRVIEIMSSELGWNEDRKKKEFQDAVTYLKSMGLSPT